jgi:ESS family glutamate:Na+ symporter
MNLIDLQDDIILLAIFLLLGFITREIVKPLQKLYIPSSVIGGVIGLILGQQVLGIVQIPDSFGQISSVLINVIMASLIFGISMNKSRIKGYMDFTVLNLLTYGVQLAVGTGLGVFAFYGGHGVAAGAGEVFKELGVPDNLGIGMILSTIGLIIAMVVGMVFVNYYIRKGNARYLESYKGAEAKPITGGVLPTDQQGSIGIEKVPSVSVSNLSLQFCFLMVSLFVGFKSVELASRIIPALDMIPNITRGMIGSAIVWGFMNKAGLDKYADKKTFSSISGFALELTVVSAISTLRLDVLTTFLIPILIYSVVIIAILAAICFYIGPRITKLDWLEKSLMNFGQCSGETTTGMALLRCVDPNLESSTMDCKGVATTLLLPITGMFPALIPYVIMQSEIQVVGIGLALTIVSLILIKIFFWGKSTSKVKA